ncbi:MAG: potassium-transporting ATPase subunit B, partial [Anaerolineae bacterium]|nr:potassium-transporting ATPase subunit B [Anaerolineae bacterium]
MSSSKKQTEMKQQLYQRALFDSVAKLDPRQQIRNPVMFIVEVGSVLLTLLFGWTLISGPFEGDSAAFIGTVAAWLWFTVLFANFAEALAEGRGKAQAQALRQTRQETTAKKLAVPDPHTPYQMTTSTALRQGDLVLVEAGEIIPADGEVIEGVALVDESAVTGESAPVIRESGGDRSAVTGGTRVTSDWIILKITANPGEGFLDRMIGLVEGAKRQKTPNEIALNILLAGFTIIFLLVVITLLPFSIFSVKAAGQGSPITIT